MLPARNAKTGALEFFYGPVSDAEAQELADEILDHPGLRGLIVGLLTHRLAPGEIDYALQVMAESAEERRQNDARSDAKAEQL